MKAPQVLTPREQDLNTPKQFVKALGVSAMVHLALILGMVAFSIWGTKPNPIVPGHRVKLIDLKDLKPSSVLEPSAPKKKEKKPDPPKVKKTKQKQSPKKKAIVKKKKTDPKKKKIVPKKEKPAEPVKVKPKPKKPEKVAEPEPVKTRPPVKTEKKNKGKDGPPRKTIVTDGVEFKHLWYLKIVERKVRQNWVTHRLDIIEQRDDPTVFFNIARDGKVYGVTMEQSSGSMDLDKSVIMAVENAQPFPPLPEDYTGNRLGVHFGFDYDQLAE